MSRSRSVSCLSRSGIATCVSRSVLVNCLGRSRLVFFRGVGIEFDSLDKTDIFKY